LASGRSLKFASCRGGSGERSCLRSATAVNSVAVEHPTLDWEANSLRQSYHRPNSLTLVSVLVTISTGRWAKKVNGVRNMTCH